MQETLKPTPRQDKVSASAEDPTSNILKQFALCTALGAGSFGSFIDALLTWGNSKPESIFLGCATLFLTYRVINEGKVLSQLPNEGSLIFSNSKALPNTNSEKYQE